MHIYATERKAVRRYCFPSSSRGVTSFRALPEGSLLAELFEAGSEESDEAFD